MPLFTTEGDSILRSYRRSYANNVSDERQTMSKSDRNSGRPWTSAEVAQLGKLAKGSTPTRVIGLKLGRTSGAVQGKASGERISLKPTNQSPYNRRKRP